MADEPLSDYRNDQLQFGQELNLLGDNWQVNGRVTFSKVRSKSILNDDESYLSLLSPRLTMVYNFESPLYVLSTWEAQWASKAGLPSSLGFALGGLYSIRGITTVLLPATKAGASRPSCTTLACSTDKAASNPLFFLIMARRGCRVSMQSSLLPDWGQKSLPDGVLWKSPLLRHLSRWVSQGMIFGFMFGLA